MEADYHKKLPKLPTTREEPDSSSEEGTYDQTNRQEYWNNDFKPLPSRQITLQNDANVESVGRLMDIGEISRDHSFSPAGTEMAVPSRTHKSEYEKLLEAVHHQHEEEKREMSSNFEVERRKFHDEKAKLLSVIEGYERKIYLMKPYEKQLETLHHQYREERGQMLGNFNIEKSRMEREVRHQKDCSEKLVEKHGEEIRKMKREFHELSSAMEVQKNTFETRLKNLRIESENTKQRMTAEHRAAKDKIMKGFEDEKASMESHLQELEDRYPEKTRIMGGQHSQELHKEDREIEEVEDLSSGDWTSHSRQQSYNRDIPPRPHSRGASTVLNYNDVGQLSAREKEYVFNLSSKSVKQPPPVRKRFEEQNAVEKLRLEKEKAEKHRKLWGDVEALKGTLGDHFKAMSYRDLALGFQELVGEIDDFSRVQWDNKREADWPFPDRVLCKSENARRSKQHIVQNTVWVILYERIFCTPFRVFGAEGKLMEREWIEKYGQGELPYPICLIRQLSSTRFEVSGGPCTLSKAYQRFRKMEI